MAALSISVSRTAAAGLCRTTRPAISWNHRLHHCSSPRQIGPTSPYHRSAAIFRSTQRAYTVAHGGSHTTSDTTADAGEGRYSTAFAFFEALWEAGVRACFVNVGSDHPSVIEAIVRGKKERPDAFPKIYTCPSEMIAISMADGYARVSGRPQAVIVHVDVGTQALAHGIHNSSIGRSPVLIFSGLSPFTESGELAGSRTEYMHWLQDAPDQKAIVRQFCRYTGEIRTGLNVKQMVGRALQFAESDPKGPVYLASAREVLAEEISPYSLPQDQWGAIGPGALPSEAVASIAEALVHAARPLVVTGYSGRNRKCPEQLVQLADAIPGLRVLDCGGSDMCFPMTHRASQGFHLATDASTTDADVILVLDCDVPWIPSLNPPPKDAQIYHVDIDPLNHMMPVSFFPANGRWKADSYTTLTQLNEFLKSSTSLTQTLQHPRFVKRWEELGQKHKVRTSAVAKLPNLGSEESLNIHNVGALLKRHLPENTVHIVEAVTSAQSLWDQLQPETPGSWLNCGGTGIGWSNGAALGARLALDARDDDQEAPKFVCQIVGDGSYMCASPASAAWIAAKYKIPILTIVLNNGGWNAPRNSALLVHPDGYAAAASNEDMNISFDPSPDYAAMAAAAAGGVKAGVFAHRVSSVSQLQASLDEAVRSVQGGKGAILDVVLQRRE